ncbi:MAG: endopeptidase La [Proteobacteria bacterium]|nr:endopeptidase La [Pseudomonadota bacterium]
MYQDEEKIKEEILEKRVSSKRKEKDKKKTKGVELIPVEQTYPTVLPLLPIAQATLFPGMVIPVILPEGKLTQTIEKAATAQDYVGVVLVQEPHSEKPVGTGPSTSVTGVPAKGTVGGESSKTAKGHSPFYSYGVLAKVIKKINLPDNQISVLLSGLQRFHVKSLVSQDPLFVAQVEYIPETMKRDTEMEALLRSALTQFKALAKDNPLISEEVKVALVNIDGPEKLADFIASVFVRDVKDYQDFLAHGDVKERLHRLLLILKKEREVQAVQKQISDEINQKVSAAQREFYLQEQLRVIQKELGKGQDKGSLDQRFRDRLKGKQLSAEVKSRIEEEFQKLETLNEQSSEYSVALNYLDWATSLPWGEVSKENHDLNRSEKVLDRDHYGLKDVKSRILEFLAVKKLKGTAEGTIICLVGPPGTGKTSLGKSIAEVLGRKFFRFSVGGMRDEAEIKGHRRTYVGAMPGKIIQGLKRTGTENPVFLIDEIDKMGIFTQTGDPASALLEVLDPEQNKDFLDHYLDLPVDCSKIFFITTANTTDSIPSALLDRMEVIRVSGYTDKEKYHIAKKHLIPKLRAQTALPSSALELSDRAVFQIIHRYARESGLRNLEKQFAKLFRKAAFRLASGNRRPLKLNTEKSLEKYLGVPPYQPEVNVHQGILGVATGLAWTAFGGEILYVESRAIEGKGGITLTGSLGEVMQESANIAFTFMRQKASALRLEEGYFEKNHIHLHVPQGATPKDGPSAGVTLTCSLYSLLSQKPFPAGLAMTGELSLTGRVLPVGGIKEKLLAAKRTGIKHVILPKANEADLKEINPEVWKGMKLKFVSTMDECLKLGFG